jgi:hypothetical protein
VCLSTGSPARPNTKALVKTTDKRSSATDFTTAFKASVRFRTLLEVILTHIIFWLYLIQHIKYFQEEISEVIKIFSGPATEEVVQNIANIPMTKRLFKALQSETW